MERWVTPEEISVPLDRDIRVFGAGQGEAGWGRRPPHG